MGSDGSPSRPLGQWVETVLRTVRSAGSEIPPYQMLQPIIRSPFE